MIKINNDTRLFESFIDHDAPANPQQILPTSFHVLSFNEAHNLNLVTFLYSLMLLFLL